MVDCMHTPAIKIVFLKLIFIKSSQKYLPFFPKTFLPLLLLFLESLHNNVFKIFEYFKYSLCWLALMQNQEFCPLSLVCILELLICSFLHIHEYLLRSSNKFASFENLLFFSIYLL